MGRMQDLTGKKFGRLMVLEFSKMDEKRNSYRKCRCECGSISFVRRSHLLDGSTLSCGCLAKEINTEHGLAEHPLYPVWKSLKDRCRNSKNKAYKDYGGRGILFHEKWNDFQPFYDWAMTNGHKSGLSIDRIDNNGNYEPDNCRLATMKEQARNTRRNRKYKGRLLIEICEELNMKPSLVYDRIYNGWDVEKALYTPVKRRSSDGK